MNSLSGEFAHLQSEINRLLKVIDYDRQGPLIKKPDNENLSYHEASTCEKDECHCRSVR